MKTFPSHSLNMKFDMIKIYEQNGRTELNIAAVLNRKELHSRTH